MAGGHEWVSGNDTDDVTYATILQLRARDGCDADVAANFEDVAIALASGTTQSGPTITPDGAGRLALLATFYVGNTAVDPLAGASAPWRELLDQGSSTSRGARLHLQVAPADAAISGGATTVRNVARIEFRCALAPASP